MTEGEFRDRIEHSLCLSMIRQIHDWHLSDHKGEKQANTHFPHFGSAQRKYVSYSFLGVNP